MDTPAAHMVSAVSRARGFASTSLFTTRQSAKQRCRLLQAKTFMLGENEVVVKLQPFQLEAFSHQTPFAV